MTEVLTYEALKADLDALAVENAALKDVFGTGEAVVNFLTIALRHTEYDSIDISDVALAFKMSLPETPATSAATAAIEARGVEKFVTKVSERLRTAGGEDGYSLVNWGEYADHLEDKGEEFAAELREAK
ncbi:hypothetical protein [Serratia ficaria]|uniref:hypothetical protein n=1 Tax=Serratia ficaria TaxID=61651 RepID=UPI0021775A70|nr:hypothetical protein [Serratia ficaria]CAI1019863.1 Uncharacterised protein [Serratia ficaria]CAI1975583.1 Uncharacterised protein [Serratia ficaria]